MKILVYGAGAVGSVLGGFLAQHDHDVTLLGRPNHMKAIAANGLKIEGVWGEAQVDGLRTCSKLSEIAGNQFDLILFTVKSYSTRAAVGAIRDSGLSFTTVASIQNGLGNTEALAAGFGNLRVLGARIITGVEQPAAGHVVVTVSADDIRIGPPGETSATMRDAEQIAQMMSEAGIPTTATSQYREYLWAKVIYNCALNPLGALLRASYGQVVDPNTTGQLVDRVIEECFQVARHQGIPLFWSQSNDYLKHFYDELIPPTAEHFPSMLRDLENRGITEIDSLNGAIVRLGEDSCHVETNALLTQMVKLREQVRRSQLATEMR